MSIRIINIFVCCLEIVLILFFDWAKHRVGISKPNRYTLLGPRLPIICERLGGAFPKLGQILSTRSDIFPFEICNGLSRLQDKVAPLPYSSIERIICSEFSPSQPLLYEFKQQPVASATVAQVHRARRADNGCHVALKIMRPGVGCKLQIDCSVFQIAGRLVARLPAMQSIPIKEALSETCEVLLRQTDFTLEAANLERLGKIFAGSEQVLVPVLHKDLCTKTILCMDYVDGMCKLNDPNLPDSLAKETLTIGVRALYKMIFTEGFIHCDMHPGNIFASQDGRLVILDAGCMVELGEKTRKLFAEFFLAIAFRDGRTAAKIVRETATRLPVNLDVNAFDLDISGLIERSGGLKARDFQVVTFVGELFAIQRKHGIYGTPKFTFTILSLLVFEGVAKNRFPDLDFQQEAVPFVMDALAR